MLRVSHAILQRRTNRLAAQVRYGCRSIDCQVFGNSDCGMANFWAVRAKWDVPPAAYRIQGPLGIPPSNFPSCILRCLAITSLSNASSPLADWNALAISTRRSFGNVCQAAPRLDRSADEALYSFSNRPEFEVIAAHARSTPGDLRTTRRSTPD